MQYTKPLAVLIDYFQRFPGIGPKSAQRIAFYLLKMPEHEVEKFANAMVTAKQTIHYCDICFNMSASNPCEICSDTNRDSSLICVCAETKDLVAIENTNEYKGKYHVLQGLISPIEGIGADDIRIKELLQRIANNDVKEEGKGYFVDLLGILNPDESDSEKDEAISHRMDEYSLNLVK